MLVIGKTVHVIVDRPLGSVHPIFKDIVYPINYGYVKGVIAPDGEKQDVYILGIDVPAKEFTGKVMAVIHRLNDVEDKWITTPEGCTYSEEEIIEATYFQEQYFDSEVIMY